ncbi:MAG TPA: hypothetical protein VGF86_06350 [Candidatus Tumulicola sp.]|jgi:hypothetical protein
MARCDPARSDYCASRHLLRHLDDARELRRNPLARDAFAHDTELATGAVRERVSRALAAMDAQDAQCSRRQTWRHAAILLRIDVARHRPLSVAADLGLSVRQFHRERRAAHNRFVTAFRSIAQAFVVSRHHFAEELLTRAGGLADSGETSSARAILEDVVGSGQPELQCAALVRLAEIDARAHRLGCGRGRLQQAEALLSAAQVPSDRRAALRDAHDAVALSLRWFELGPMAIERDVESVKSASAGGRALLVRAAAALRCGESGYASRTLRRAGTAGPLAADDAVDLLTLQAELADFTDEDPLRSERLLVRAIALAREHGLRGRQAYAEHQLRSTQWMRSRVPSAAQAYRRLTEHVDRMLSPRLRASLAFCAADIEVAIGHPQRALRAAHEAARLATNPYEALSARALAAGALLRSGRIAEAGTEAELTADAARGDGNARIVSLAQRISAQAHLAQGNRRAARAAIEEALDCARRFSSAHVYGQARAVLGHIMNATIAD